MVIKFKKQVEQGTINCRQAEFFSIMGVKMKYCLNLMLEITWVIFFMPVLFMSSQAFRIKVLFND